MKIETGRKEGRTEQRGKQMKKGGIPRSRSPNDTREALSKPQEIGVELKQKVKRGKMMEKREERRGTYSY